MKVEIAAPDFGELIQKASVAISRKTSDQILLNVLLVAGNGLLRATGTDGFVGGSATAQAAVDEDGAVAVDAARLLRLAEALPKKKTVKLTLKNDKMELRCGPSRYHILYLPAEDFPQPARLPKGKKHVSLSTAELAECVRWAEHGMANDDNRLHLSGMLLDLFDDGTCNVVSCDGYQLIKATAKFDDVAPMRTFIPYRAIPALRKLCDQGTGTINLASTSTHTFFWIKSVGYSAKKLKSDDPIPYNNIIPKSNRHAGASVDRQKFLSALKRITAVHDTNVTLFIDKKKLKLTAQSSVAGDGSESMAAKTTGKPLQIMLSAKDIQNSLSAIPTERVLLHFWGEKLPVMICPDDDGADHSVQCVHMPLAQDE